MPFGFDPNTVWVDQYSRKWSKSQYDTWPLILTENPDIGKSRVELFPGALSFPVGSHLIFYRKTDNQIEIARVLHKRMDYERHITE